MKTQMVSLYVGVAYIVRTARYMDLPSMVKCSG